MKSIGTIIKKIVKLPSSFRSLNLVNYVNFIYTLLKLWVLPCSDHDLVLSSTDWDAVLQRICHKQSHFFYLIRLYEH